MAVGLRVLTCNNSLAPNDRVAAGFDSQRVTRCAELSCDYNNKKDGTRVSAPAFASFVAFL